ncbi:MAG: hypothetical protein ACR2PA_24200 [Hyphomicrobiaceae bacterium]
MLIALGFLLAMLLGFVVAPAYWARAVRLTTERLRRSIPMTEAELRADKDRLRAQHAIRVHQLETRVDTARTSAARQIIEINRRDGVVRGLENEVQQLNATIEASENARRVLEQTIMDRVPRVEARLSEARNLLFQRDRDMAALQADTSKTYRALDEAMQINAQQRAEIDRLKSAIATRSSRSTAATAAHQEDDTALRSELEALRTRTRDQASLIAKLQEVIAESRPTKEHLDDQLKENSAETAAEVEQLESGIRHAQDILESLEEHRPEAISANAEALRRLNEQNEEKAAEIEKLRASLKVYEEPDGKSRPLLDSRLALKSRVAALEKETATQTDTIKKLRAEMAAANDRNARQAAHHMNEMRKLGAGTRPLAVAENAVAAASKPEIASSLADRITKVVPSASVELARTPVKNGGAASPPSSAAGKPIDGKLSDGKTEKEDKPLLRDTAKKAAPEPATEPQKSDSDAKNSDETRPGLMQRIAGLGKT